MTILWVPLTENKYKSQRKGGPLSLFPYLDRCEQAGLCCLHVKTLSYAKTCQPEEMSPSNVDPELALPSLGLFLGFWSQQQEIYPIHY